MSEDAKRAEYQALAQSLRGLPVLAETVKAGGDAITALLSELDAVREELRVAREQRADELYALIAHGDDAHRQWLRDKVDEFYAIATMKERT